VLERSTSYVVRVAARTRWLDDDEQRAWRAFLTASQLVDAALDRQLQRDARMPHAYYGILTALVEAGAAGVRMSDLAERLRFSPSRLAHAVGRLESNGWVRRRSCKDDRRGQTATITAAGRRAQAAAAPGHVAEVRARLFDHLNAAQVEQLTTICAAIIEAADASEASPPVEV
jgi:DNA-binding MarR family transcriptional regulator